MQLSMLIGKRVLTPQGEALGYVKSAYLTRDLKGISCLCVVDGDEEEFYLPAKAVRAAGDAVIAGRARLSSPVGIPAPIGLPAFTDEGRSLGSVCDWVQESEPLFLLSAEGERTQCPCARTRFSEALIVFPEGAALPSAGKSKSSRKRKKEQGGVEPPPVRAEGEKESATPRAEAGQVFGRDLLGRRVRRTVLDDWGTPVARTGEPVTPAVLARARHCNRLLALAASTLSAE